MAARRLHIAPADVSLVAASGAFGTNTLPGLTTSSLVPQELAAAGISFRDFLEKQVALAAARATISA